MELFGQIVLHFQIQLEATSLRPVFILKFALRYNWKVTNECQTMISYLEIGCKTAGFTDNNQTLFLIVNPSPKSFFNDQE